jgi:hypothetical protein
MVALAVLAITAAIVSYQAQFRLILNYKGDKPIAALQAGIPDAAALVMACLGIALALHGKRAIRARVLNLAAVGTSVYMNLLAASAGWKALAVWALAPVAYAVTSDTLIGVLRAYSVARQKELNEALADDEATPLAVLAKVLLYGLRFALAPISTATGARRAVLLATPVPDKPEPKPEPVIFPALPKLGPVVATRPALRATTRPRAIERKSVRRGPSGPRANSKTSQLLQAAASKHGNGQLADVPLESVGRICAELAPGLDLNEGSARKALRTAVLAAQNGAAR